MEILNYREVVDKGSVIAEFDVYITAWKQTIHNYRLIRTKKGALLPSCPSYCVVAADGGKKFYPYVSFSGERQLEFNKKILELVKPFLN